MPLDEQAVNHLWWGGYCAAYIESIKNKKDDAQIRIDALKEHIDGCIDCRRATIIKNLEGDIAALMNPGAKYVFKNRGDITVLPDFQTTFEPIFDGLVQRGELDAEFIEWMEGISKRYGKPYKGRRAFRWK